MKTLKIIFLFTLILFTFTSCITYTIKDGLYEINTIDVDGLAHETRYKEIVRLEAEAQAEKERLEAEAKAEAQRKYDEELALKQNLEAINTAIEKKAEINPYPQNLDEIKIPHIFRPLNSKAVLNDKLTKLTTLFLPLGQENRTLAQLSLIAQNVATINLDLIFVTGSRENQVNFAKALNKDSITLNDGTIIFSLEIANANENNVSFKLCEDKVLSATALDVTCDGYKETLKLLDAEFSESQNQDSKAFNLGVFAKMAKDNVDNNKQEIVTSLEGVKEPTLFAISQSEPATVDWSIFTPYPYRTDFEWPLSTFMLEQGYRDTFEETRYSVEESAGITQEIGENIKERFDFLYSKGLMEVSSSTLTISGLTDTEDPTFALMATYIIP